MLIDSGREENPKVQGRFSKKIILSFDFPVEEKLLEENIENEHRSLDIDVVEDNSIENKDQEDEPNFSETVLNVNHLNNLNPHHGQLFIQSLKTKQTSPNHEFSLTQSNILYALFFVGFSTSIFLDIFVQVSRKGWNIAMPTYYAFVLMSLNFILWVDFVREYLRKEGRHNHNHSQGWIYDLINYSTNGLVCCFLFPFFGMKKYFRLKLFYI